MMNIQLPVRLIIFIYQPESLLCCSMSIGYWCNMKWVLFSYVGGDISHTLPKKQQQQQQETAWGWSEHQGCKWRKGLSRSSNHETHFCCGRQVWDTQVAVMGDHPKEQHSSLLFRDPAQHKHLLNQPWELAAEGWKQSRNHPCGVGDWVSVPGKVPCLMGATCTSPLAGLQKSLGQRKLRAHLPLSCVKHLYEPDLELH